jgi:pSer/pThr/pTyr-binding forkhead associated (FHA) protein
MKKTPVIIIQFVHIQGPMKGEIQEFSDQEISIGRHPSCHVQFPKDLAIISRQHARVVREGNRFKLIDQSTNGTFLNGKRVNEAFLKDGDVLIFAEGGPKVSFLTRMAESPADVPPVRETPSAPVVPQARPPSRPQAPPVQPQAPPVQPHTPRVPSVQPPKAADAEIKIQRTQVPLIIQYGPTLRSFKELPVTIGKSPQCDFCIDHPNIFDRHAQIFFTEEQYWVKDLTGRNQVSIDGAPVQFQSPLSAQNRLSLSLSGPSFRFLGAGRLAEIEEAPVQESSVSPAEPTPAESPEKKPTESKGARKIIDKFFKS